MLVRLSRKARATLTRHPGVRFTNAFKMVNMLITKIMIPTDHTSIHNANFTSGRSTSKYAGNYSNNSLLTFYLTKKSSGNSLQTGMDLLTYYQGWPLEPPVQHPRWLLYQHKESSRVISQPFALSSIQLIKVESYSCSSFFVCLFICAI